MISFSRDYNLSFEGYLEVNEPSIKIFGELLGVVYERNVLDHKQSINMIEKLVKEGNNKTLKKIIRGVVGQCFFEIKTRKYIELWASCSSSGFVFGVNGDINRPTPVTFRHNGCVLYCCNDEGDFYSNWKNKVTNAKITQEAILNAIISHQSVIRPPFDGLYENTYRCQPGCLIRMKPESIEIEPYIVLDEDELMDDKGVFTQEDNLKFALDAVARLYKNKSKYNIAFSGGLDSSLLMLALKEEIGDNGLIYKSYGKNSEERLASYLAELEGFKLRVIAPKITSDVERIRKKGATGLATFNGVNYLRHGFESFGFLHSKDGHYQTILTGQNADTLFHVDHFGPDNRVSGLVRVILILKSMKHRSAYSMPFYKGAKLLSFFNFGKDRRKTLGMLVMPSLISLGEHDYPFKLPAKKSGATIQSVVDYKDQSYYEVFSDYYLKKYKISIDSSKIKDLDPGMSNHIVRTIRWLRTIGSFQQQFHNMSQAEKVNIVTPYSEGPLANILLNWQLGVKDVFSIKRFSHEYIKTNLGISYSKVRKDALGGEPIVNILKSLVPFKSIIKRLFLKNQKAHIVRADLSNLRDILGHEDGIIERVMLNYVNDKAFRDYLNFLYDCLELKVAPETLTKAEGMRLCRLVNLQVMLETKKESVE